MKTSLASSTSPASRARSSAAVSSSSARAIISCTLSTERIWPGIFCSMLWHWSSISATSLPGPVAAAADHLDEDPEQLERVGRPDDQVVVGVEPAVEVERAELPEPQQLRDDELDVGPGGVVPGVEADHGPLAERRSPGRTTCPSPARPCGRTPARRTCTPAPAAGRRTAGRRSSPAPRPASPGGRACRPGRGSWCRRPARSSGRATRSGSSRRGSARLWSTAFCRIFGSAEVRLPSL